MELQMCQDFRYILHFRSFQFCSSEAKWRKKLSHFNDFCHYFFAKIFFENSFTIPFVCSTFLSGVFTSIIFRLQHEVFIYCIIVYFCVLFNSSLSDNFASPSRIE